MLKNVDLYYFSPTGGTKTAGEIFCDGISENVKTVDLGRKDKEKAESDFAVFSVPVFGGRVPAVAVEKLKELDGSGKQAVTIVVFGNRAYEDALLELNGCVSERGFRVIASAALVARHSMLPEVAKGRPDEEDRKSILGFAEKVLDKIERGINDEVKVPGNYPYKEGMRMPAAPVSLPACTQCKTCFSVCPTGAVQVENDKTVTSPEKCILCMACVYACPEHARILPPPLQENLEQMLSPLKLVRNENEYYL